ncbi:MAG: hypothetical protein K5780_02625, partial [Alphaproteobacteria bacterium]|nr:hypothetical protein [Alphaproteobacteria bacterium]
MNKKAGDVPEVNVTTDDVKSKVVFTFEELSEFVEYMQDEKVGEVSDKITIVKTDAEKIDYAIAAYMPKHNASQTKPILEKIVEYLQAQGSATVDRDDVKEYLKDKGVEDADEIALIYKNLVDLKECLREEGKDLSVEIVKAVGERIYDEVHEYYGQTDSEGKPKKVGNLTEEEAYDLAMYMRGFDTETTIKSDITGTDTVPSIKGKTITHKDLVDFVGHLNAKEEAAQKGELKVTVNRTT